MLCRSSSTSSIGRCRGQPGEHLQNGLERPPPLGLRAAPSPLRAAEVVRESGQQPGEHRAAGARQHPHVLGRQLAQRLGEDVDERLEEERSLGRVAAADQHPAAGCRRDGGRLVGQPGLADPGLAREQQHGGRTPARRLPGRTEQGQLGVPADDARGAGPGGHRRQWRPRAPRGGSPGAPGGSAAQARRPSSSRSAAARLAVGRERPGGLADLPVCPHQQPVRGLVEPVVAHGSRGEVHRLATAPGAQRGLGGRGAGRYAAAPDLVAQGVHPVGVRLPHQRGSGAEQYEGPPGRGRGDGGRPCLEPAAGLVDEARRLVDVHARRPQSVPAAVARDDVGAQLRAQPAHQRRDVALGALGWPRAPQRVDQPFGRDDLTAPGSEQRQQPARLGAADHPLGPGAPLGRRRRRRETSLRAAGRRPWGERIHAGTPSSRGRGRLRWAARRHVAVCGSGRPAAATGSPRTSPDRCPITASVARRRGDRDECRRRRTLHRPAPYDQVWCTASTLLPSGSRRNTP